jgi:hypothetical protein
VPQGVVTILGFTLISLFQENLMCLICVEYNKKRMTRDEIKKALPEMVMFAKTEEDKNHYKKLQILGESKNEQELEDFALEYEAFTKKNGKKTS